MNPLTHEDESKSIVHNLEEVGLYYKRPKENMEINVLDGVLTRSVNGKEVEKIIPARNPSNPNVAWCVPFQYDSIVAQYDESTDEFKRVTEAECKLAKEPVVIF